MARVAAAGQLLSFGNPLKYTSRIPPQSTVPLEINGPERWGASNHTNVMHFSNFHPGPVSGGGGGGGKFIQLLEKGEREKKQMCDKECV